MTTYMFLADENIPLASIRRLRDAGYGIAAISDDTPGIADTAVLARAVQEGRVLLTLDRDYGELIYRLLLPAPAGVVYVRFQPATPGELADRLLQMLALPNIVLQHAFTIVYRSYIRQRPLP